MAALESSANWRMVAPPLPMMLPHSAAGTSSRSSCDCPSLHPGITTCSARHACNKFETWQRTARGLAVNVLLQCSPSSWAIHLDSIVSCTVFSLDIFASTRCSAVSTCRCDQSFSQACG